jgi:hypothetical protein
MYGAAGSSVSLDGPHLAVLLMNWCRSKHVPLPRQASKSIRILAYGVVLSFDYNSRSRT